MNENRVHQFFVFSVVLKGLNAALEILLGVIFIFSGTILGYLSLLVSSELVEDPSDFVAVQVQHLLPFFTTGSRWFVVFYLLSHGLIKLFLVWGLLKNKLWAYPASLIFLALFMLYQIVKYTQVHNVFLILLTAFDLIVFVLVWHEYRILSAKFSAGKRP